MCNQVQILLPDEEILYQIRNLLPEAESPTRRRILLPDARDTEELYPRWGSAPTCNECTSLPDVGIIYQTTQMHKVFTSRPVRPGCRLLHRMEVSTSRCTVFFLMPGSSGAGRGLNFAPLPCVQCGAGRENLALPHPEVNTNFVFPFSPLI